MDRHGGFEDAVSGMICDLVHSGEECMLLLDVVVVTVCLSECELLEEGGRLRLWLVTLGRNAVDVQMLECLRQHKLRV